ATIVCRMPRRARRLARLSTWEAEMHSTSVYQKRLWAPIFAAAILAASSAQARDTRTEEPVFDFSSPFVSAQGGAAPVFYIWKVNRIDGSLYLCQTTSSNVRCNQVAGPSDQI